MIENILEVVIVDDEAKARENLQNILDLYFPKIKLVATFDNAEEALQFLYGNKVDCIFLDIEMSKMSGIELSRHLNGVETQIVFVTGYRDYAFEAFKLEVIGYILKPINLQELRKTIEKVWTRLEQRATLNQIAEPIPKNKITLNSLNGFKVFDIDQIVALKADGSYSHIIFNEEEKAEVVTKPISYFEKILDPSRFIRIHNSHLINLDYLQEFTNINGGSAKMKNGELLIISRRRLLEFKEKVNAYYYS